MSAALMLAATTLGIQRLRYVTGEREDGTVQPGSEIVRTGIADRIGTRKRLAAGWGAVRIGQFAAALALFSEGALIPDGYEEDVTELRVTAQLYGAWDRFDYTMAARQSDIAQSPWGVDESRRHHLERLARTDRMNAAFLRHLTADVVANASRRLWWGQPEDALVRVYRASELIGQLRMALRGLDSAAVSDQDSSVREWLNYREKRRDAVNRTKRGALSLARHDVARYLKHVAYPLGKRLLDLDQADGLQVKERNNSLLAHGFSAVMPGRDEGAFKALRTVESLSLEENIGNAEILRASQFLWFAPGS